MIKRGCCFLAVLFTFCLAGAGPVTAGPFSNAYAAATAPDFALEDIYGNNVRLSDYFGKNPILLVFSTTWCPHCRTQIPLINDIYSKFREKGLVVLNVDIKEPADRIMSFAKQHRVAYPIVLDPDAEISKQYKVVGVPTNVLIARDGSVVCNPCRSVEKLVPSVVK